MTPDKVYTRRLVLTLIGYMISLPLSLVLLAAAVDSPLRYGIALLPVVPVIFGLVAFLSYLRSMDELQQRIQLEAFGFSLGCTGLLTFTIGFLENAGLPQPSLIWVFPTMVIFWGIGQFLARRRYL